MKTEFLWRGISADTLCSAALAALLLWPLPSRGADLEGFGKNIAAGRFVEAGQTAQQEGDPATKDRLFARISLAQSASGDSSGAQTTANRISDPALREKVALGGAQADFDTLIDLIQTTIAPDSWEDVGGRGSAVPFPSGVLVSPDKIRVADEIQIQEPQGIEGASPKASSAKRSDSPSPQGAYQADSSAAAQGRETASLAKPSHSPLRAISLARLERQVALALLSGKPLSESLLGLADVDIFLAAKSADGKDIILMGSTHAGGRPMRLDHFAYLLRHIRHSAEPFGCSIAPRVAGIAALKNYVEERQQTPLASGEFGDWVADLRTKLGPQDVSVFGMPADTAVASTLVEADYHMKLLGMGLAPSAGGLKSYLKIAGRSSAPASLETLRWWFVPGESAIVRHDGGSMLELVGMRPMLRCENELLTELGSRVHTGQSSPANQEFAQQFTEKFDAIADRYPVYQDLRNVFRLTGIAAAVVKLSEQPGSYSPMLLEGLRQSNVETPRQVESVVNAIRIKKGALVAGVSGGVEVNFGLQELTAKGRVQEAQLDAARNLMKRVPAEGNVWWWD